MNNGQKETGSRPDWILGLNWLLATTAGCASGVALGTILLKPPVFSIPLNGWHGWELTELAILGLLVGFLQWMVLWLHFRMSIWWILATAISWPATQFGGWLVNGFMAWELGPGAFVAGLLFGVAQWLTMRRKTRSAGWWILVTVVAWSAGLGAGGRVPVEALAGELGAAWSLMIWSAIVATVYGIITGAALLVMTKGVTESRRRRLALTLVLGVTTIVVFLALTLVSQETGQTPTNVEELVLRFEAGRRDFAGLQLPGADLRGIDFRDDVSSELGGIILAEANLSEADLSGAHIWEADLSNADLSKSIMVDTWLPFSDLSNANLAGARLVGANLGSANLQGADLRGATLTGADLERADLRKADLRGADLTGANLEFASLGRAILDEDGMYPKQLLIRDIATNGGEGRDLSGVDLSEAMLDNVDFSNAILKGANLEQAHLSGAILDGSDLSEANLSGTYLSGASLIDADMSDAYLSGTTFSGADLTYANLSGADMDDVYKSYASRTTLRDAILRGANLRGAQVSDEQLQEAASLDNAVLPDGSTYNGG